MEDTGVYTIALKNQKGSEIQGSMVTATAMQYSPEYRFDQTADGLEAFVSQVNGAYITYEDPVFDDKLETVRARTNLAVPFLITALVLFLLDIAVRRMGMDYLDWFTQWKQRRKWKKEHPEAAGTEKKTAGTDVLDEKQKKAAEKAEQKAQKQALRQAKQQARQEARQEAKASRKRSRQANLPRLRLHWIWKSCCGKRKTGTGSRMIDRRFRIVYNDRHFEGI